MADDFNPWANVPLSEALPFGAGATPQGSPTALSGALSGVMNIPKHLIDSAATNDTGAMVGPAADAAMALMGVGAPAAEAGAAGIFGGRLSPMADLKALQEAEKMRMGGVHPDNVWRDTNWGKLPSDGQWRFEIPDNKAGFNAFPIAEGDSLAGPTSALVRHPDLYKAYPEIRDYHTDISRDYSRPNGAGEFNLENPASSILAPNAGVGRSVMLHELQHGVQGIEGFSPGANPRYYAGQIEKGLRSKPEIAKDFGYEAIKNQAYDLYHRTAGEVEARNVQTRADMTPAERLKLAPWRTQDVPFRDQFHFDPITETLNALRRK